MDPAVQEQLHLLERRCRSLTGIILAIVAFVATYCLLLIEGQTHRPAYHSYPWIMGGLFYLAGDLLAMVWYRYIVMQMVSLISAMPPPPGPAQDEIEDEDDVEVIRPEKAEG